MAAYWKAQVGKVLKISIDPSTPGKWQEIHKTYTQKGSIEAALLLPVKLKRSWFASYLNTANSVQTYELVENLIDRLDLKSIFTSANLEQFFLSALESNTGWEILVQLLPIAQPSRYDTLLSKTAAKSSDLAHFILIERLYEPFNNYQISIIFEDLLAGSNIQLLAYYAMQHPKIAEIKLTDANVIGRKVITSEMAEFVVLHMSDEMFNNLRKSKFVKFLKADSRY